MLTKTRKRQFVQQGFLHVKGVVSRIIVNQLLHQFWDDVFKKAIMNAQIPTGRDCKEESVSGRSAGMLAAERSVLPIVREILGARPKRKLAQRIVEFPKAKTKHQDSILFHIDGDGAIYERNYRLSQLPWFQLAVGIYLSDLTAPERGRLHVTPGGHLRHAEYVREQRARFTKAESNEDAKAFVQTRKRALAKRLLPFEAIDARPGDIAIFHNMMPHYAELNTAAPRPAVYFRFGEYPEVGMAAYENPWAGFKGITSSLG